MSTSPFDGTLRLNDGVLIVDAGGVVRFCNSKACVMLGWQRGEVLDKALEAIDREPRGRGELLRCVEQARASGEEVRKLIECRPGDQTFHIEMRAFIEDDHTNVILEDRTRAHQMEQGLSRFVGPSIVDQLRHSSLSTWQPSRTKMTLVGVAPAEFSFFAERLEPQVLRDFLNDYVRRIVEVAQRAQASIVKLSLPSILLGYGPPDHARRAVEAVRHIATAGLQLARQCALGGIGAVKFKLAINTGMVVVGPVGCTDRMEYTMLGHNVDIVTRLLDQGLAGSTTLTHATREELGGWAPAGVRLLDHGPQRIWGIERPIGLVMLVEDGAGR